MDRTFPRSHLESRYRKTQSVTFYNTTSLIQHEIHSNGPNNTQDTTTLRNTSAMHPIQYLGALIALGSIPSTIAASCGSLGGTINGECVAVFSGTDCNSNDIEVAYKPTCEGNCFVMDYSSLFVSGDGFFGTDCIGYSDTNCQVEMSNTGNVVSGDGRCQPFPNAKSMKCYYRC